MMTTRRSVLPLYLLAAGAAVVFGAIYEPPAGNRPAIRRPGAASILPGGRVVAPAGLQYVTGPGPLGLAISPNGKKVVTANSGPDRFSLTVIEQGGGERRRVHHLVADPVKEDQPEDDHEFHAVSTGLAFEEDDDEVWISEGNSGRVKLIRLSDGRAKETLDLNGPAGGETFADSFSADLAIDRQRRLLYVVDSANFRLVVFDLKRRTLVSSLRVGRLPFAIALDPAGQRAYVTHVGMFQYNPIPGVDLRKAPDSGLPFPAFGFPSADASNGVDRTTGGGNKVRVPGLGDPNAKESNSLAVIDLLDPASPKIHAMIRTGTPLGPRSAGGSSPSGVLATAERVFVSNAFNDTVTVINSKTLSVIGDIPVGVPGLENLRGFLPLGMALDEASGWLLVAEAGANAVAVIDLKKGCAIAHLPVGWFPTRVAVKEGTVFVANARGHGTGPNAGYPVDDSFSNAFRRGSVSVFPLPTATELPKLTGTVFSANGYLPKTEEPKALPREIRHVVVIAKEGRTFDEVFGDIQSASNGAVAGAPQLALYGADGYISGQQRRFSLQGISVTPNHRKLAERYSFSDNFYTDGEFRLDGHHWLMGAYPNAWTQASMQASHAGQDAFRLPTTAPGRLLSPGRHASVHPEEVPEGGTLWHHLDRHNISFRNFGGGFDLAGVDHSNSFKPTGVSVPTNIPMPEALFRNTSRQYPGFNLNIPDQVRADEFIREVKERYGQGKEPLPQFLFVQLPNDQMGRPRPADGYPYEASYLADNDYALGRIVEFLSHTPWWRNMAIFITESSAQGGVDHIDSHRTVLIGAGPYFRRNYVSHVNTSFGGLLKTIFRLLGVPPLNLFDATAADLSDCFTTEPNFDPYAVEPVDSRLFVPAKARPAGTTPPEDPGTAESSQR